VVMRLWFLFWRCESNEISKGGDMKGSVCVRSRREGGSVKGAIFRTGRG